MNDRKFIAGLVALLAAVGAPGADSAAASPESQSGPVFYVIPHTHWEGAVFITREEYLEMGLPHILTVVRLLKEHPNYRFALDQVEYFRPFLSLPGGSGCLSPICVRRKAANRLRTGHHARRQYARRRIFREADALRQGILPPGPGR